MKHYILYMCFRKKIILQNLFFISVQSCIKVYFIIKIINIKFIIWLWTRSYNFLKLIFFLNNHELNFFFLFTCFLFVLHLSTNIFSNFFVLNKKSNNKLSEQMTMIKMDEPDIPSARSSFSSPIMSCVWVLGLSGVVVLALIPGQVVFSTGSETYKKVILNISSDNVQENILATHWLYTNITC